MGLPRNLAISEVAEPRRRRPWEQLYASWARRRNLGERIMATIVHKGTKPAFEDRGAGKPALLFVHGFACDRSFFAPQVEHFAR
jgi:hypothetical protein